MAHVTWRQNVGVWIFLVFASLAAMWLAEQSGWFGSWTIAVVLTVAVFKARAIILYYMEIKFAPPVLRMLFEAWVAACFGIIVGFRYFG